jgi:hypothetical protein
MYSWKTRPGRIQALIFMVVNLVLQHHQHQVRFSDYKSAQRASGLEGEPDAVLGIVQGCSDAFGQVQFRGIMYELCLGRRVA